MSKDANLSRREFIQSASVCVVALPALSLSVFSLSGCSAQPTVTAQSTRMPYTAGFGSMPCSSCIAPQNISWRTTIVSKDEKGDPLIMSGTIYQADGTTPAEGIVLFVYHTDSTGYYNKDDDPYNPRLRGYMKTGKDGRYEFKTIKPAPYPKRTTPAHIHAQIYSSQIQEYAIDEYWFEGDPFITPEEKAKLLTGRGGFNSIIKLTRGEDGVLRGVRNIKLDSIKK
ncbi:MAG: protocatechuate 3,4-dioxygenase, beta subunit [Acidobacteriota bacterium]|nr:protocatechuate 3,4-dioxygenase, beta subunit [Acidobacteriota bacterium]